MKFEEVMTKLGPNPTEFKMKDQAIIIEGIDGAGKSALCQSLFEIQPEVPDFKYPAWTVLRQPGGTPFGEGVRSLYKEHFKNLSPMVKARLIEASRLEMLEYLEGWKVKNPAVWHILDRHHDSTLAYQLCGESLGGLARKYGEKAQDILEGKVTPKELEYISSFAEQLGLSRKLHDSIFKPTLTIFLDVDYEVSNSRRVNSGLPAEAFDSAGKEFFTDVRQAHHDIIRGDRSFYHVIDASQPPDVVLEQALFAIEGIKK